MSLTFCAYFVIDRLWILPSRPRRVMRRTSVAARLHKPWQLLWMFARRSSGAHVIYEPGRLTRSWGVSNRCVAAPHCVNVRQTCVHDVYPYPLSPAAQAVPFEGSRSVALFSHICTG